MPQYIEQKVMEAIEELIGEDTSDNRKRLTFAVLKARIGAIPKNREIMSQETLRYLSDLKSEPDFYTLREAFLRYISSSLRDAGIRDARMRE
ncbi:MAG: hypothetical protein V2A53_10345 [bacterium]